VEHTGTRFFLRLIADALGCKWHGIGQQALKKDPDADPLECYPVAGTHLQPENMSYLEKYIEAHDPLIVLTVRGREATEASWTKRGKPLAKLVACRSLVHSFETTYKVAALVSVDHPERDKMLANLCAVTGLELSTNWQAVGSYRGR
jgi:hypothetical protein